MKTVQLKPIVARLTNQLLETLTKLEPGLKNDYWAKNPNLQGICFLIEKTVPAMGKAGEPELKQIFEVFKAAKEIFWLQKNDSAIATCFVFVNNLNKTDQVKMEQYFWKEVSTNSIKSVRTSAKPFNHFMTAINTPGFTQNTLYKLFAKKHSGEIEIFEQANPLPGEPCEGSRAEMKKAIKPFLQNQTLLDAKEKIHQKFEKFCHESKTETQLLTDRFLSLESLLSFELETRRNTHPASYIKLPFDDQQNKEIIDLIYHELNGQFFTTTKENFHKIFKSDKSFIKIEWKASPNLLVCLFTGFDFNFDGFDISFPGLMQNITNKWATLAEKFHIPRKSEKTPLPKYFEIVKRKNQKPNELEGLLPLIKELKKGWCK